jgi:hypothetical protein
MTDSTQILKCQDDSVDDPLDGSNHHQRTDDQRSNLLKSRSPRGLARTRSDRNSMHDLYSMALDATRSLQSQGSSFVSATSTATATTTTTLGQRRQQRGSDLDLDSSKHNPRQIRQPARHRGRSLNFEPGNHSLEQRQRGGSLDLASSNPSPRPTIHLNKTTTTPQGSSLNRQTSPLNHILAEAINVSEDCQPESAS